MSKYLFILIVVLASCESKSGEKNLKYTKSSRREVLKYSTDEDVMYLERIKVIKDVISYKCRNELQNNGVVELWLKGKTHTNKLFLTKYDFERVKNRRNYLTVIKYEQFLFDSVSTHELGMLTEALKTSKEMVRERKLEYQNKKDLNKYFLDEIIHYISTCNRESMDYLLGIDILLYKNKDYPEYNRRCIQQAFEYCGDQNELEEW